MTLTKVAGYAILFFRGFVLRPMEIWLFLQEMVCVLAFQDAEPLPEVPGQCTGRGKGKGDNACMQ
jgi:hypothetical protein